MRTIYQQTKNDLHGYQVNNDKDGWSFVRDILEGYEKLIFKTYWEINFNTYDSDDNLTAIIEMDNTVRYFKYIL